MLSRARQLVAPLYLFLCLILGGSAQGIWGNMVLQLLGLAIIAWAATSRDREPIVEPARQLMWIAILGIAVVAIQVMPLPSSLWPHLGGRQRIADNYRLLGIATPALPISLTPYKSLDSVLGLIPGLAVFCAIVRLKAYRGSFMAAALLAGAVAGVLLGALQVTSANPLDSPWYLYPEVSFGFGVGFFANANHMATLLVICLPFLAALVAAAKGANLQRYSAFMALAAGAGLVMMVGIALNHSLAVYGLAFPVLAASALIVLPPSSPLRGAVMVLAAVLLAGAIALIANSAIGSVSFTQDAATSVGSREDILALTWHALKDYFPWGTGLGSFRDVYFLYENPATVTTTYVVHAHNDYAELALELGLAGIAVLVLFLIWWGAAVRRIWQTAETGSFARAASIASAAILAHSLVDFPLRTAAISAAFGMCLALLADRRPPQIIDSSDLRPTRHFVLR
jgi:O-antigen ligase